MLINRLLRRFRYQKPEDDSGAGGGAIEPPAAAPSAEPASAPVAPAAPAPAPLAASAPAAPAAPAKSMLDAISEHLDKKAAPPAAAPGAPAPRDPTGRFVPKTEAERAAVAAGGAPAAPGTAPAAAPAADLTKPPGAEDDPTAMPDGLTPKAQERFQKLATQNRELTEKFDSANRQVSYVRDTFQANGIKQDQFETAATLIGLVNKGDFDGAQRILQQQMQQLAVLSGKPIGQVDALASFPDLRQAVDGMQVTEEHALEIARSRTIQQRQQQDQQRQQQTQQATQVEQQAVQAGTAAVDAFVKRMQAADVDYPAIEAQLIPELPNLLKGVPPQHWGAAVEAQYRLVKKAAGAARIAPAAAPNSNPLRATGSGSLKSAPKSIYEAMWGEPAPR